VIKGADLVLVCTDNNPSRYRINECCLRHKVPAVYAGAYERAFGGQIMRVIPGVTPCYDCVIGGLQKALGNVPTQRKGPIPYSELNNPSEFKAEPGLSIDVHMIALIQAKMALLTLLRGTNSSLEDFPCDFILWGNRKEWIFPEPLYCKFAKTRFREDCPTCQMFNTSSQEQEEARREAERIVEGAVYDPDVFQDEQGDKAPQ
jgi:molybdopterin/thiamine biosynthesis adenylyltransferase